MTGEQEPWRAEYDRCVAAYRIDDPVIDVAAARLANGWHPDSDTHPGDWAVSALADELHKLGGWGPARRQLLERGCSAEVLDSFEADATEYDGPFALEGTSTRIAGDATFVVAMTRQLILEEYSSEILEGLWDEAVTDRALASALAAGGEMAALAERVVSGELERDHWVRAESDVRDAMTVHAWVSDAAFELATPFSALEVPSAPAILEVWSRALDALPPYGSAPYVVGAVLEDLLDLRSGAWWAWGRDLVAHRVQIMDSVLGAGSNVSTALSGCWVSPTVDVFGQWADLIRRRGLQARGVTEDDRDAT